MAESNLFSRQLDNGTWEYSVKNGDVFQPISPADYKYRSEAEDASSLEAGYSGMTRRVMNGINKVMPLIESGREALQNSPDNYSGDFIAEPQTMAQGAAAYPDMEREAMQREHPVADAIGGALPYLAAVPAAIASGGSLPAAMIAGAASGALFADEGEVGQDALIGGALPMVGGALVKGGQMIRASKLVKKAKLGPEIAEANAEISDEMIKAYNKKRVAAGAQPVTRASLMEQIKKQQKVEANRIMNKQFSKENLGLGAVRTAPIGLLDARGEAWERWMK